MSTRSAADLFIVSAWTITAVVVVLAGIGGRLRILFGLPLAILLPGYALVSVLFPTRPVDGRARRGGSGGRPGLTDIERLLFSVALSFVLVPFVAFVLSYVGLGIRLRPLVLGVGGLTLALAGLGLVVRLNVPAERRQGLPRGLGLGVLSGYLSRRPAGLGSQAPFEPETGSQRLLNVVFVVAILLFATSVGYAVVTPSADDKPFTEFYLLTEQDDGELRAENLPREFSAGERASIYVAIANHEREDVSYTVVVRLAGEEVNRFTTDVQDGHTKRIEHPFTLEQTGNDLALTFNLYKGQPSGEPYREVSLQVSVG